MRDLFITLIIFGSMPVIFKRPWFGVLMWVWISGMSPHRLSWGFAYNMPFALVIAVCTLVSVVCSKESKSSPWNSVTMLLLLFTLCMNGSTMVAFLPQGIFRMWDRTMKMMLMTFVTIMAIRKREHIHWLIWTLVASLGFYG